MKYLIGLIAVLFASSALAVTVTVTSAEAPAVSSMGWHVKLHVTVANAGGAQGSLTAAYKGRFNTVCAFGPTNLPAGSKTPFVGDGDWELLCSIVKAPANPGPYSSGANSGDTVPIYATFGGQMFRTGSGTNSPTIDVKLP